MPVVAFKFSSTSVVDDKEETVSDVVDIVDIVDVQGSGVGYFEQVLYVGALVAVGIVQAIRIVVVEINSLSIGGLVEQFVAAMEGVLKNIALGGEVEGVQGEQQGK